MAKSIDTQRIKPQQEYSDNFTKLGFLKKFKRLKFNIHEPSLGVFGFLVVVLIFTGCLFYGDYRAVTRGLRYGRVPSPGGLVTSSSSPAKLGTTENGGLGFLDEGGDGCDMFDGKWVWDDDYPLYDSKDCSFADSGFRCLENDRPDSFYTKWRWQPNHCNMPRFDAKLMLEKLRNRRLVFVGDSLGRNQWESLLCMLASAVPDNSSIYEVNNNPITKHNGFLAFMFKDYNCTVEYYRSPYLVFQGRPPAGAPKEVKVSLRVDSLDTTSSKWKDADVLIFNSGHWWTSDKTTKGGCYFQEGEEVKMEMSVETAFQRSIETVTNWINREVDMSKTQVLFRSYVPAHYRGGDWKTDGTCHLETLPYLGSLPNSSDHHAALFLDILSQHSSIMQMELLNVTSMSTRRKDGHPSLYYLAPGIGPASVHHQDCSHWCLPGVPDSWNELLYALFLKRESLRTPH